MPPTPKDQLALDFAAAMTKYSSTAVSPVAVSDAWAAAIELYASSLGGGTATDLATTGLSVNVSKAAPPAKGDALVCTNIAPLEAQWAASPSPGPHSKTHQDGGGDEVAVAAGAANAIPKATKAGVLDASWGGGASSLATLDASAKVAQLPVVATETPTAAAIPMTAVKMTTLDSQWLPDAGASKGALVLGTDLGGTAAAPNVLGLKGEPLPATVAGMVLGRDATNKNWVMTAPSGGAATALATTGADVDVSGSAPPAIHKILVATDVTHSTWQYLLFLYTLGATASIAPGAHLDLDITGWFNSGMISHLGIQAASASTQTMIELYYKDSYAAGQLAYRAGLFDCYTSNFQDMVPFYYEDSDHSGEIHLRIYNYGSVASTYSLQVDGVGLI
jgi:hypothetical protein